MSMPTNSTLLNFLLVPLMAYLAPQILTHQVQASDPNAYVSTTTQDIVAAYNPSTGQTTRLAGGGIDGASFAVSPDETMAYVAAYVSYPGILEIGVTVADLTTGKTVGKITSVTPVYETGLAVSPDGSLLYLVSQEGLTALNAANLAVAATAPYSTWYVEYETGVWSAPM